MKLSDLVLEWMVENKYLYEVEDVEYDFNQSNVLGLRLNAWAVGELGEKVCFCSGCCGYSLNVNNDNGLITVAKYKHDSLFLEMSDPECFEKLAKFVEDWPKSYCLG